MRRDAAFVFGAGLVAAVLAVPPGQWVPLAAAVVTILLCAFIGLQAARRLGLMILPPVERLGPRLAAAIGCGIAFGAAALVPLWMVIGRSKAVQTRIAEEVASAAWRRVLISVDSAIIEEIGFRLFILSCIVWIVSRFASPASARLTGNVLAAIAFALAHVPRWIALQAGVEIIVIVIAVNLVVGLVLGAIYLRWGLLLAITAHLAGDLTVHVAGPYLLMS